MSSHKDPEEQILSKKTPEVELVDIEEHGKGGKTPPKAQVYRIRIDDHHYTTDKSQLTGTEILALASKKPESFNLRQRLHGGRVETVLPDTIVDLLTPGLERFITIPKENTEGEEASPCTGATASELSSPRRAFVLSEADTEYLDANHSGWEAVMEGNQPYVILKGFPILEGYNHTTVDAAILISAGYPATQLDMVYFNPHLSRTNDRPIRALATQTIDGKAWQRWSRHYSWRAGIDDLSTHAERIKSWLEHELLK